jgi:hypothetical protein
LADQGRYWIRGRVLSLLTGFFNTVVAGVGAWIAVTQWRASRAKPAVTAPPPRTAPAQLPAPPPTTVAEPPASRKLARAASVAVAAGAGTAVFAALTALLLGLFVLVAGLVKRRKRIARLGLLAVVLSQTLWLAMWLTAAI